ncbi:MAG TPA: hypothetical protein PKD85_22750, partial [Saprospiraceae bacterium]|nr:hypothetical protein [Saprospiraceae bacterium]
SFDCIIIDTVFVYPGKFSIIIDTIKGGTHTIEITKFLENKVKTIDEAPKYESPKHTSEAIEYVDGFGKLVPNEDLILREKAIKKIYEKLSRRLEYVSYGRDGKVIYIEGDKSIQFYMEMGGYNCVFYLNIPSKINWEKETNFSIEERDEILSFVAEGTKREHATSCRYEINDNDIAYYRN